MPEEPSAEPSVTIYHNTRCSKSRAAKSALEEAGVDHEVRDYLDNPPSRLELLGLIEAAGGDPRPFVRTKEDEAEALDEGALDDASRVAEFLAEHPRVLQRPVLLCKGRAAVARDPRTVEAFLDAVREAEDDAGADLPGGVGL